MSIIASKKRIAGMSFPVLLLALTFAFTPFTGTTEAEELSVHTVLNGESATFDITDKEIREDVLWLARCIYSETKRPDEQELVAWVVRNRVETGYRGSTAYRDAVLDPWQFSAFNRNSPKRRHYSRLGFDSRAAGWQTALYIAYDVLNSPAYERPFPVETRHFYSEQSMRGRTSPNWANGQRPVSLDRQIDPKRFRFYSEIR